MEDDHRSSRKVTDGLKLSIPVAKIVEVVCDSPDPLTYYAEQENPTGDALLHS